MSRMLSFSESVCRTFGRYKPIRWLLTGATRPQETGKPTLQSAAQLQGEDRTDLARRRPKKLML